jgi:ABC-type multidrug transport system ATPase subunit
LDEPTSNLDSSGVELFQALIQEYALEKTLIVASNYVSHEYQFCTEELILEKHY